MVASMDEEGIYFDALPQEQNPDSLEGSRFSRLCCRFCQPGQEWRP